MSIEKQRTATFRSDAFEVATIEQAKQVTVTAELGTTTEERWEKETQYLTDDITRFLPISAESCVLDYGSGLGRISKELIARCGCRMIGVDASKSMRQLSPEYVLSERFTVWSPEVLDTMIAQGFQADFAISLWVIQHVFDAQEVIQRITRALAAGGLFYTLNSNRRCVPTDHGWVHDGFDVQSHLRQTLVEEESHFLPPTVTTELLAKSCIVQVLRKLSK